MTIEINATNFPDPDFRQFLLEYIDTNSDGLLNSDEVEEIDIPKYTNTLSINSFSGIELLTSLKKLNLSVAQQQIVLDSLDSLEEIQIYKAGDNGSARQLTNVSVTNCTNLKSLRIPWCYLLTSVNVNGCEKLEVLDCFGADLLTTLSLQDCYALKGICLRDSKITSLDLSGRTNLEYLNLKFTESLERVNLSGCIHLKYLWISVSPYDVESYQDHLTSLNIQDCQSLRILDVVGRSALTSLILPASDDLHTLELDGITMPVINIHKNITLMNIVNNTLRQRSSTNFGVVYLYSPGMSMDSDLDTQPLFHLLHHSVASESDKRNQITIPIGMILAQTSIYIYEQPGDLYLAENETGGTFSVVAYGDNIHYQWEKLLPNETTWEEISNSTTSSHYIQNNTENLDIQYRCRLYDPAFSTYTALVTLHRVTSPVCIQQPTSVTVLERKEATFQVGTVQQGYIQETYQWQVSADSGSTWNNVSENGNHNTYSFRPYLNENGRLYRCLIRNIAGETVSDSASLYVEFNPSVEINETNFPDPLFRQWVLVHCDYDGDGFLDDDDLAKNEYLNIFLSNESYAPVLASIEGIKYFKYLKILKITSNDSIANIPPIDLSGMDQLEAIELLRISCSSIDLTGCTSLISYSEYDNNVPSLDFTDCPNLQFLSLEFNSSLNSISFPDQIALKIVCILGCPSLSMLVFPRCASLSSLDIVNNHPITVNISGCPKIERVYTTIEPTANAYLTGNRFGSVPVNIYESAEYATPVEDYTLKAWASRSNAGDPPRQLGYYLKNRIHPSGKYWCDRLIISTDSDGFVTVLTEEIQIVSQPQDQLIDEGQDATFEISVIGVPPLSYQWQMSDDGSTWQNILDGTTTTLTISEVSSAIDGKKYRCLVSNSSTLLPVISKSVTLTVLYAPIIQTQPNAISVLEGNEATLTITTKGNNNSYQWQKLANDGETWNNIEDANDSTLSFIAEINDDGNTYRCVVSNDSGNVISDSAAISVSHQTITIPSLLDVTITEGQIVTFDLSHTDGYKLTYQWQTSENGVNWTDIRYATEPIYTFMAALATSGRKYRCVVTGSTSDYTATSTVSTLTVNPDVSLAPPVITRHPSSQTITEGSTATFIVLATGEDLHYRWQTYKNGIWVGINNATSLSYEIIASMSMNGVKLRCQVSNDAGSVISEAATLTVINVEYISTPRILIQPRSVNVDLGELVTFWIEADGGNLRYQWQKRNDNVWYDITGAIGNTYSIMARTEVHNTQYRCVVSNIAGSAYSNSALLSIRAGQELSFYGYHSIIISGKNTYGEWEMYPTSRPHVAPPEVKTSYVDLPGADGGLDYTDLLTGEPRYGYRKGSWEFLLIPQDRWAAVYRSLVNFLHGKQHTVILEDDPNYVYTGRLSVNEWRSAAHNSLITIDYLLEPFPRNISGEEEDEEENMILSMATTLLNKAKNAGMVIGKLNGAATLVYPDMLFENGDNIAY